MYLKYRLFCNFEKHIKFNWYVIFVKVYEVYKTKGIFGIIGINEPCVFVAYQISRMINFQTSNGA